MIAIALITFTGALMFTSTTTASKLIVSNRCPYTVNAVWTGHSVQPQTLCTLNHGAACEAHLHGGGNLKSGYGGLTLAEFQFAADGKDWYDLSVVVGYDVSMSIEPLDCNHCPGNCYKVTCLRSGCPDAYLHSSDDSKTHCAAPGSTHKVVFCP